MESNKIDEEIGEEVQRSLKIEWAVSNKSDTLIVESKGLPAYAQIEAQQDGSYIVTGYVKSNWDGEDSVPVLDFYVEVTDAEAAIDELLEYCQVREELEDEVWTDNATVVSLETITNTIEETDAVFAAVPEDHLVRGLFRVTYHVLPGGEVEGVANSLNEFEGVEIDGKPYPLRFSHTLAPGCHLYRRLPLHVMEIPYGPEGVETEHAIQRVREFVETDAEPTPRPSESVEVDELIKVLADAGAVTVAADADLCNEDRLTFAVAIPDATVYEDVASYDKIKVGETTFELEWLFNCIDGPEFLGRVPVYAVDNIGGIQPVTAEEGLTNLIGYIEAGCPTRPGDFGWGEMR